MQRQTGVTLLEAMVAISILSIVSALAVSGFVDVGRSIRLSGQVSEVVGSLQLARSEAIKRNGRMTVCPSTNGTACLGDPYWEGGWIVFADPNGNGAVDVGEAVVSVRGPINGGNTLRSGRDRLTYQGTGLSPGFNDTFRLCDLRGAAEAKRVVISMTGRVRVANSAASCP